MRVQRHILQEIAESTTPRHTSELKKWEQLTNIIEISDAVKLRAAQRGIDKRAPFHRQRNGIDDAILIEVYGDKVREKTPGGTRFAFVTHNTKDFSHPSGNNTRRRWTLLVAPRK